MDLRRSAALIDEALPQAPDARPGGSVLMMVGLPGSGKSSIARELMKVLPHVVISTDEIRARLQERPIYSSEERMLVYEICYAVIEARLKRGQRVVFDASNYLEARREDVIEVARRCGAPAAVCHVQASMDVVGQRLMKRRRIGKEMGDLSDADWAVYKWMVETQEPVAGPHLILDTTAAQAETLAGKLHAYWLEVEASAASNPDLQPPSWADKFSSRR